MRPTIQSRFWTSGAAAALLLAACAGPAEAPASPSPSTRPPVTGPFGAPAPVAPQTQPQGPDVYLRDSELDTGAEPREPDSAASRSPDIVIDAPPFGRSPETSDAFDAFRSERLAPGKNRIYVRVFNGGGVPASGVAVELYTADGSLALPAFGDEALAPAGSRLVEEIPAAADGVAASAILSFTVSLPDPGAGGHQCLVVSVGARGDLPPEARGRAADQIAALSNNVVARNMDEVAGSDRRTVIVRNPLETRAEATIRVSAPDDWKISASRPFEEPFTLDPGESFALELEIAAPEGSEGAATLSQVLTIGDGQPLVGSYWFTSS
jgi:hypothetical protein